MNECCWANDANRCPHNDTNFPTGCKKYEPMRAQIEARNLAIARRTLGEIDPRDPDPTKEGVFRDHNCYRCKDGALPCIKGKGNERNCETLHARND